MRKDRKPLTPLESLANLHDSLADDVLAGHIKADEATNRRAFRIARAAIDKALSPGQLSDAEGKSPTKEWTKRTGNDEAPIKGQAK